MAKGFILGIVVAILLVAGGMYVYFSWGFAPVATSASPMPLERKLAKSALHAYLNKLPHPQPMVPADEANLIAGSKVYKEQCATRSEEHTSELQSRLHLVCRLLL